MAGHVNYRVTGANDSLRSSRTVPQRTLFEGHPNSDPAPPQAPRQRHRNPDKSEVGGALPGKRGGAASVGCYRWGVAQCQHNWRAGDSAGSCCDLRCSSGQAGRQASAVDRCHARRAARRNEPPPRSAFAVATNCTVLSHLYGGRQGRNGKISILDRRGNWVGGRTMPGLPAPGLLTLRVLLAGCGLKLPQATIVKTTPETRNTSKSFLDHYTSAQQWLAYVHTHALRKL